MFKLFNKLNISLFNQKLLLAFSGIFLLLFLVAHLIGNLQFFFGATIYDSYADALHEHVVLLIFARFCLFFCIFFHMIFAINLLYRIFLSKKIEDYSPVYPTSSIASRTMFISGIGILVFIVFHLLHVKFRIIGSDYINYDLYTFILSSFSHEWIVTIYLLFQICLYYHISHALFSVFQTFGFLKNRRMYRYIGHVTALMMVFLYSSIFLTCYIITFIS